MAVDPLSTKGTPAYQNLLALVADDPLATVTVAETAALLNLHPRTIRARIRRGEIPAFVVSTRGRASGGEGEYRIKRQDLAD
jgi:excisionase family DNA binding protein